MAAVRDTRPTRLLRWTSELLLRVMSVAAIFAAFTLLTMPTLVFEPGMALWHDKLLSDLGGGVRAIILAILLLLLGTWLRRMLVNRRQAGNDRMAQYIAGELLADPAASVPEFFLYLRAFETTGRLRVPLYLRLRKFSLGLSQLVTNDVESYVSTAVRRVVPLIALGRPGEAIGAGRVTTTEERWTTDVLTLMRRAKAIMLVPSSRPGTLWEIETLKREALWTKVIFIMPPLAKGEIDTRERWEAAPQAMSGHDLEAPEYQPRGLLFEIGLNGKVNNVEPMLLNSPRQVRKSIARILSPEPPKGGLFKAIAKTDKRTRRAAFWGWAETVRQLSPYPLVALALLAPRPSTGFDPNESWATVFERSGTLDQMGRHDISESVRLGTSEKYLALEAAVSPEQLDEFRAELQRSGLKRLDDADVRNYISALGGMMARVNLKTCAAIARGEIEPEGMQIAFTYIPIDRIAGFLRARTNAILAEAEERPMPPSDPEAVNQAPQRFLASLDSDSQQRYQRIDETQESLSDDDACWLIRTIYNSATTLPEPHASVWARWLLAPGADGADAIEPKQESGGAPRR